ncbi:transcriptional regulator [Actinomadura logoneensis]|uniref:Transcriptional regulator n=1 Tax=Actinomadura logoneensis TaxID=2293572 RepID=A0A372JPC6_9ACTN|nr:helix-turn-helix domain-containing protein [Actinomadura logoneensis]RFU41614.1 transcriptional regulator [Actinomadura logoneensis]
MPTMTAEQRRAWAKAEFDAYMETCPTSRLMAVLGNKWTTMLLTRLAENGTMRHARLARAVPGISAKVLTQSLRALERDGLVARHVTASVPVQVDYTLTVLGESLMPVVATVRQWADRHMPDVEAARGAYDAARAGDPVPAPARSLG